MFQGPGAIPFLVSTSLTLALNLQLPQPLQNAESARAAIPPFPANKTLDFRRPYYSCTGGPDYGDAISLSSCYDAADEILDALPYSHRERLSFGDRRGVGGRGVVVQLPYISLNSDGECALEIVSRDASRSDLATILQFSQWALDMVDRCQINHEQVKGGKASNLGLYGSLGLVLTQFDASNIACRGPSTPDIGDCDVLLNTMPVEETWQVFGSRGRAGVNVGLPYMITQPGRRCLISVYTMGPPDRENWYTLWKYAAAVAKICVSERRKPGTAYGLGEHKNLYVEMTVCAGQCW